MLKIIDKFTDDNFYLSNFFSGGFKIDGVAFSTVEHFFQASKTTNMLDYMTIANADTPREAKSLGRKVSLRPDWEKIKDKIMYAGLYYKFTVDFTLNNKLISTGTKILIEGNTWHDNYWGMCSCSKCTSKHSRNTLGILLMTLRTNLINIEELTNKG